MKKRAYTKRDPVVGEERDKLVAELVRRYEAGASIRGLATEKNRSYGFVHNVLREAGVQLRPRGGANKKMAD